jgi:hypothetical protein
MTAAAMPFQGGYGTINVVTDTPSCAWTVTSGAAWITIPTGNGTGVGPATFYTAVNTTGTTRTGTISIAGKTVTITQPGVNLSAVSDMSGDVFSDLLVRNTVTGDIQALGVSNGIAAPLPSFQFSDGTPIWNVPVGYSLVGTGDLNGDGYADIVWQHQSTGNLYAWMMHGITIIATPALSIPSVGNMGWQVRGVGDVNGDGRADLIFQNTADGSLAVWLMNGETVTSTMWITDGSGNRLAVADTNWVIAGVGDLNHDGKGDLVWQNRSTGALGGWTMSGNVVQAMQNLSPAWVPPDYKIGGVGDVNGDGVADLIWIRQSTGEVFVWCMSGANAWWTGVLLDSNGHPAVLGANWTLVGPG